MIHRELNVLRKLQSMGSTKVEIAARHHEDTEQNSQGYIDTWHSSEAS